MLILFLIIHLTTHPDLFAAEGASLIHCATLLISPADSETTLNLAEKSKAPSIVDLYKQLIITQNHSDALSSKSTQTAFHWLMGESLLKLKGFLELEKEGYHEKDYREEVLQEIKKLEYAILEHPLKASTKTSPTLSGADYYSFSETDPEHYEIYIAPSKKEFNKWLDHKIGSESKKNILDKLKLYSTDGILRDYEIVYKHHKRFDQPIFEMRVRSIANLRIYFTLFNNKLIILNFEIKTKIAVQDNSIQTAQNRLFNFLEAQN